MCAVFTWPACPDGRISVPGRRAAGRGGRVVPGRPRYDVQFVGSMLDTENVDEVAAVRRVLATARGEIKELSVDGPVVGTVEATPQALAVAIERLTRAIARDEELDQLCTPAR